MIARKYRKFIYIVTLSAVMYPFQNCGPAMKSATKFDVLDSSSTGSHGSSVFTSACNGGSGPTLDYVSDVKAVVVKNCAACHMNGVVSGGFSIPDYTSDSQARQDTNVWNQAIAAINQGIMPQGSTISASDKATIVNWFANPAASSGQNDPGFVQMQRLTPRQWDNSVSDLLGMTVSKSSAFPADPIGKGQFSNDAATIASISAELFQQFQAAADSAVESAFANASVKQALLNCSGTIDKTCAQNAILNFARRAYRRPIATTADPADSAHYIESTALTNFVASAASTTDLEAGVKLAMKSVLLSPKFLYRVVILPSPNDANQVKKLDAFELAAQLSYFLWDTIPDEQLFSAAQMGDLLTDDGLRAQVMRMLASPRSQEMANELADGWLGLKDLQSTSPSDPAFTETTRASMRAETTKFLAYIAQNNKSPLDVLTANYSFVNDELAGLYGMSKPGSSTVTLQTLPANRKGIFGHASILTMTTKGATTSPIFRGVWSIRNIMCETLGAPPANVPPLDQQQPGDTVKDILAAHRANPQCSVCHNRIDPIGLSFENFDPLGRYRTTYPNGQSVDAGGALQDGTNFVGTNQFADALVQDKKFAMCMAQKVLSFSIARTMGQADSCAVEKIGVNSITSTTGFVDFITALAKSDPFQKRRGSGE